MSLAQRIRAKRLEITERWSAASSLEPGSELPELLEALANSVEGATVETPSCERFGIAEYRILRATILDAVAEDTSQVSLREVARLDADLDRLLEAAADRSAVEQRAELRQAIHLRDEFLSLASHELRTPLASLDLALENLERRIRQVAPDEVAFEWIGARLATASRQGKRLQRLANELLDVSRITGERLQLSLEPVALTQVVKGVLAQLEEQGAVTRSKCKVDFRASGEAIGRWDRLRIQQIVTKVVENALKFGAGEQLEISVTDDGTFVELFVRDHGIGIATADRNRNFARFERAVPQRHYGGFGLELWIVRQIVEAMSGSVHVESELGQGSTFIVRLPKDGEGAFKPASREASPYSINSTH